MSVIALFYKVPAKTLIFPLWILTVIGLRHFLHHNSISPSSTSTFPKIDGGLPILEHSGQCITFTITSQI